MDAALFSKSKRKSRLNSAQNLRKHRKQLVTSMCISGPARANRFPLRTYDSYDIPIIFITACPDEGSRTRALKAGAVDFLEKPFGEQALLNGIRSALKLRDEEGRP